MNTLIKQIIRILISSVLLCPYIAIAGGFMIHKDTVNIAPGTEVQPGEVLTLTFDASDYTYSGDEFEYVIFALAPKIESRARKNWQYYYLYSDRFSKTSRSNQTPRYFLKLQVPIRSGEYKLLYSPKPMFLRTKHADSDVPETLFKFDGLMGDRNEFALLFFESVNDETIIVKNSNVTNTGPSLYLSVDDQNPAMALNKIANGGLVNRPIKFSWFIDPNFHFDRNKFLYRFKLWHIDREYGPWTSDTSVRYHFLEKGNLTFSVQAKYRDIVEIVTQPATVDFRLNDHLVAKLQESIQTKAGAETKPFTVNGASIETSVAFETVYANSRALIVGVHNFDDKKTFTQFPVEKINKDIEELEKALRANGFEVTKLFKERLTRDEIISAIDELVNNAQKKDRILIYFSTHGFPDPKKASAGWLATSDCNMKTPTTHCIALEDLERQANRLLDKPTEAQQVLIAVDSCFSGLGVVSKATSAPNFARLATKPGAYMLTAGMADQKAQIDPKLGMSTFTYYLSKGLSGDAEKFDRGGIINLSDLYVYVQWNVANQTKSTQIPMLGRLAGDGEMLFKPLSIK